MRLYPKKLRNIDDLEREKKRLLKESRRMEEEGFLSIESIFNNKSGKDKEGIASLLDLLPVSNPLTDILIRLVKQRLSNAGKSSNAENATAKEEKKQGKNPLKKIAVEFIGGYLKWKVIELSYKGIRYLIKKRKEKKAAGI